MTFHRKSVGFSCLLSPFWASHVLPTRLVLDVGMGVGYRRREEGRKGYPSRLLGTHIALARL